MLWVVREFGRRCKQEDENRRGVGCLWASSCERHLSRECQYMCEPKVLTYNLSHETITIAHQSRRVQAIGGLEPLTEVIIQIRQVLAGHGCTRDKRCGYAVT